MSLSVDLSGLVLPEAVQEPKQSEDGARASFLLQPLERGFGHTIGNSIRRIMLSSLPGAAIWAFRADGVQHEHQTIDGVAEDVHQIIQNLKQLVLVMDEGQDAAKLSLSVHKAGPVKAKQIAKNAFIRIVNPDLVLFTLQEDVPKDRPLTADLWVKRGRGFVMAEQHVHPEDLPERHEFPVGTIRVDSVFNPVTRANFFVRETRVGQRTDYDRLEIDVETNGALEPAEAVSQAAEVARVHLLYLSDMGSVAFPVEEAAAEESGPDGEPVDEATTAMLKQSLQDLPKPTKDDKIGIPTRTKNILIGAGIETVGDLVVRTADKLKNIDKFGDVALEEVQVELGRLNLHLGMRLERGDDGTLYRLDTAAAAGAEGDDEA